LTAEGGRLARLLGDPDLAWLLSRARRRLELGQPLDGVVTLADASPAQRRAVQRLLGRAPRAGSALSVSLGSVDELLRRSGACDNGLEAAVMALTGPVVVRADALAAEQAAWERVFAPLEELVERRLATGAVGGEQLVVWLARLRGSGAVKRTEPNPDAALALLQRLAAVLEALPADGEPLARFAARVAGGAHALDDGRPLAALALGAARALARLDSPGPEESQAEARREVWAGVGLLCDELSSVVLALGLPGDDQTATGQILEVARKSGQPVWLTLRQLVRDTPNWAGHTRVKLAPRRLGAAHGLTPGETGSRRGALAGVTVHICENPAVLALAADRLGCGCAPLVCTGGQPGAAAMHLLRALAGTGARLVHHGDFDWGGVRIGNVLHARLTVAPWRFDAEQYVQAATSAPSSQALSGASVEASWDPDLAAAMRRVGRRIEEELVVEGLLSDLAE
jgi:uncharacterized protein (TIGR02679 family)